MKPLTTTMKGLNEYRRSLSHPEHLLDMLQRVKANGLNQYLASCPCGAHKRGDIHQSLSVRFEEGKILLHCFGGCSLQDLCTALGLEPSDLFFQDPHDFTPLLSKPIGKTHASVKACTAKPLTDALHVKFWERLEQVTEPFRGFSPNDRKALGIAQSGDDAVLAITDPLGNIVALKKRHAVFREGQSRYFYLTKDCGTPAWCSPCFWTSQDVLIIEGEINGMSCALVRHNGDKDLAVMGVAGTGGSLWLEALKDKDVYVYGDDDKPGQEAKDKWALAAYHAGAKSVMTLEPWEMDANDILAKLGPDELRERIL
jgi:hypothetical protein